MRISRRKLLITTGTTVSLASLIGTGAFSSVSAERKINVEVANDSDALLTLVPVLNNIRGSTLVSEQDGLLTLDTTNGGASGVNNRAITKIGAFDAPDNESAWVDIEDDPTQWVGQHSYTPLAAFGIENRGTQTYNLTFEYELDGDAGNSKMMIRFYDGANPGPFDNMEYGTFTIPDDSSFEIGTGHDNDKDFSTGKRVFASVKIDTTDGSIDDDLTGTLTITAEEV